jgi:LysM repeat protein
VSVIPGSMGPAVATFTEVNLATNQDISPPTGVFLIVDFDPSSLELSYSVVGPPPKNNTASAAQRDQAPAQMTGQQTTLSMTLIFDSTMEGNDSVEKKTDKLVALTTPGTTPPGSTQTAAAQRTVRFDWGNFSFTGAVSSLRQTIDYFASGGIPKRATVNLSLLGVTAPTQLSNASSGPAPLSGFGSGVGIAGGAGVSAGLSAGIGASAGLSAGIGASVGAGISGGAGVSAGFGASAGVGVSAGVGISAGVALSAGTSASIGVSASVGITPLTLSAAGDTVQSIAAQAGTSVSWKVIAANNNIDNPRVLPAGTVLNLTASSSPSLVAGAQVQVSPFVLS